MPSETTSMEEVQPSASSHDDAAPAARSLPESDLTLTDHRAFTEGLDSQCSIREDKAVSSPGSHIAGPAPASTALSPCVAGGSTAATPSPLPDEEFKEEGLICAAVAAAPDIVVANVLHSQLHRSEKTQKERGEEAERESAEHERQHQMHSGGAEREGERAGNRSNAKEEEEKQKVQDRAGGRRDEGGRGVLGGKDGRLGEEVDTQVCPTLLHHAGIQRLETSPENNHLRALYRTKTHNEESGALNRTESFCNAPSSPSFGCLTSTPFVSVERAVALSAATTSPHPKYHALDAATGGFQRKEGNIPGSPSCGASPCSNPSVTARSSVPYATSSQAKEEPEDKRGIIDLPQSDRTGVLPSAVINAALPASSSTDSSAVAKSCVGPAFVSLSDHPATAREKKIKCKKVPKRSGTMRESQCNWKTRAQYVFETNAAIPVGPDHTGKAGIQDCSSRTLQGNCGSTYRGNSSLGANSTKIRCRNSTEAKSHVYSVKALLAARRLVEGLPGVTHAEEAFDKVQRELQSRYVLVERGDEKVPTTPAAEHPQGKGRANAQPGLLPSESAFPLSPAGLLVAVSTWTDPIHAGNKTSRPPPPPPPPPSPCLPHLNAVSSPITWQRVLNGNSGTAATVPAPAAPVYETPLFDFAPLVPAPSIACRSINSGNGGFSVSSTVSGTANVEHSGNREKATRTSLNPLAPAFQPQGKSFLLRLLVDAAENTSVESHFTSRLHCQRGADNPCSTDTASALTCAEMARGHPNELRIEEPCSVERNRASGFIPDPVDCFTHKCVLPALNPANVPTKKAAVPLPDHTKSELLLPHLLTVRAEQHQQQSSLYLQQTCQKQLQQFHQAASIQALLHCASKRIAPLETRQQVMEAVHHQGKQQQQQPHQQQIHRPQQHEDLGQAQAQRITLATNFGPCEQRILAKARSYIYPLAEGETTSANATRFLAKSVQQDAGGPTTARMNDSCGEKTMSFAFMHRAKSSTISGAAASALSRSSNPFGNIQDQQRATPVGAVFSTAGGGGLPGHSAPISRLTPVSHTLRAIPSHPLRRSVWPKAAGLNGGLAEVLDPLVANRMLLQLGKTLRLTHLQVLTVIRRASVAGVPVRLTDLPAAFLKEHNAILDLRSLGLLHIREVIAGMGRSLLLSWKQQRRPHSPEEQHLSHIGRVQQHSDEHGEEVEMPVMSEDAFGIHKKSVAAEGLAAPSYTSHEKHGSSSRRRNMPGEERTFHGEDSEATHVVTENRENGGGEGNNVQLKQPGGTGAFFKTAKGARPLGDQIISGRIAPVPAVQGVACQSPLVPINRTHGVQHPEATVDGSLGGGNSRGLSKQEERFQDEGDLLLLEGDPLPSVMKELLQHFLVSVIADALRQVGPPALMAEVCRSTDICVGNRGEAVAGETVCSLDQGDNYYAKHNSAHHLPEETSLGVHGNNLLATEASIAMQLRSTAKCSRLAASRGGACAGSCAGSETLEGSRMSEAGSGPMYTRGLPLQLIPTLWQLKYGVRCNLPAMLETCGYSSVRKFIIDALPCLHFSASGTYVALRLTGTKSACPAATCGVTARGAEKSVPTNPTQTDKRADVLCADGDVRVPGNKASAVILKAEEQQHEPFAEVVTPTVASLENSGKAATLGAKEGVSGRITLPEPPTFTEAVSEAHAQDVPAEQSVRSEHEFDSRAAETLVTNATVGLPGEEPKKSIFCQTHRSVIPKRQTTAAAHIIQGGTGVTCKPNDAESKDLEPARNVPTKESDSKATSSGENLTRSQVASTEKMRSANRLAADEITLPTVLFFRHSSITPGGEVDKRDLSPPCAEELRRCSSPKVDQLSPLPTLLACPLVEQVAAAKMQELEQQSKSLYLSSCLNDSDVPEVGSKGVCKKATLDTVRTENLERQHSKFPPPQQDQLPDAQVLQHHKLNSAVALESFLHSESKSQPHTAPVVAEKLACSPKVVCDNNNRTPTAASLSCELQENLGENAKNTTAKKGYKVVKGKDGKAKERSDVELVCSPRRLLIASAAISSEDETFPRETLQTPAKEAKEGVVGNGMPAVEESFPLRKNFETVGINSAGRMPSAGGGETVGIGRHACAAHSARGGALMKATKSLFAEMQGDESATTEGVSKRETHSETHEVDNLIATGDKERWQRPDRRRRRTVNPEASTGAPSTGTGMKSLAETIAPRSRFHLHCMLYEVVATGCEKRGRAWARGEDLIELEEEVRQKEDAAAQLQELQQLSKQQQQQLFQQMVKSKEQLLRESYRIGKQMQEDQERKEREKSHRTSKLESGTLVSYALSEDEGGEVENGDGVAATGFTTNTTPSHRSTTAAARLWQDHSNSTVQHTDNVTAAPIPREKELQSKSKTSEDGTRLPSVAECRPEQSAEETRALARESASSSDTMDIKEEKGCTDNTEEQITSEESEDLSGRSTKQTTGFCSTASAGIVQRQSEKPSEVSLARATTTVGGCRETNSTDFIRPRLAVSLRQKSCLSGPSLSVCSSKLPTYTSESVLGHQNAGETSSSSDDSASSRSALLSPTEALLDDSIKVLMDERVVRRRLKKQAKKDKKRRKKLKLRALEMQEKEQRRLLGLLEQLVELPEQAAVFPALFEVVTDTNRAGSKCVANKRGGVETSAESGVLVPQELKSTSASPSSLICVSSVAISSAKSDSRCPSSAAVSFTPSCGTREDLSQLLQHQPSSELKNAFQSTVRQCEKISTALDQSRQDKEKEAVTNPSAGVPHEQTTSSPRHAALHDTRCATTTDCSSHDNPPLGKDTSVLPSLKKPSGPQSNEQQQERQADRVQLEQAFTQQLQHEFVSLPRQHQCSEQQQEQQQTNDITQQQQTSLSFASSAQLAEELRRYRNRSVGMLVSAIKGEWQRRFSTQAPPLSACMSLFEVKQLKALLLEVPNLLILGTGGTMRVCTIEHALQFCHPFPPSPSTLIKSPSGRLIASPMTMTSSSPLICFRAHIYTHDGQSNIPVPLTSLAATAGVSAANTSGAPLEASTAIALPAAASCSSEAAADQIRRTTEEQTQQQQIQQAGQTEQQNAHQNVPASQELQDSTRVLEAHTGQKKAEDCSCTTASPLRYKLRTGFQKRLQCDASSGLQPHSCAQILKIEMLQEAGNAARKSRAHPYKEKEGGCSTHKNKGVGLVADGEGSDQMQATPISAKTIGAFNKYTGVFPLHADEEAAAAASPVATNSQADSLAQGDSSDITTTQLVENAPIEQVASCPSAAKALVLGLLTADAARRIATTKRISPWMRAYGEIDSVDMKDATQKTYQQETNPCATTGKDWGTQRNDSVRLPPIEGCFRRLLLVQQEAFHDLKGYVLELQRRGPDSDQVEEEPRQSTRKQQQHKQTQCCIAKLLLSIVEYRCNLDACAFPVESNMLTPPKCKGKEDMGKKKQEHLPASSSEAARTLVAVCKPGQADASRQDSAEFSGTLPGERLDFDEEAQHSKYDTDQQTHERAASPSSAIKKREKQLLYVKLEANAEAQEEARDWKALLQDLFALGLGRREDQGASWEESAGAGASKRTAEGSKYGREHSITETENTPFETLALRGGLPGPLEEAAPQSCEQYDEEQQQQELQQELGRQQDENEQDLKVLQVNERRKDGEVQKMKKDETQEEGKYTLIENKSQKVHDSFSSIKQREEPILQTLASATDKEETEELVQNKLRNACASHLEVWKLQKQGSTGVPLREVLRDWRRVCYRLFHEVKSCCCSDQGLTTRSNGCSTKEDRSQNSNSSAAAGSETRKLLTSSLYKFPAELISAAGWSSVLPGLLLNPAEEEGEEGTRRFCITCNMSGEFYCYPATIASAASRPQYSVACATVSPASKSSVYDTPAAEDQSCDILQPAVPQQECCDPTVQVAQEQQQQLKCLEISSFDQMSNASPGETKGRAATPQQQQQLVLPEHLPNVQGEKRCKTEEKRAQQQIESQQQNPVCRSALQRKSLSTNTAALITGEVQASKQAGRASRPRQPMTQEVYRKSVERLIAAVAGHYRGLQAEEPQKGALVSSDKVERKEQQTVGQCKKDSLQHTEAPQEHELRQSQLQQQQQQQQQGSEQDHYSLQEVLRQRLEQSMNSRGHATTSRNTAPGLTEQATEHCRLPRIRVGLSQQECPTTRTQQSATSMRHVPSCFLLSPQNVQVSHCKTEQKEQQRVCLLQQGETKDHSLQKQDRNQPQFPQLEHQQLQQMKSQQGLLVQEHINPSATAFPSEQQQGTQVNEQQQQMPSQQMLLRLQGKQSFSHLSQEQKQQCRLLQMPLDPIERDVCGVEAGKDHKSLPAFDLQHKHVRDHRAEAGPFLENQPSESPSEKRLSRISEAATFAAAAPPPPACRPYSLGAANRPGREARSSPIGRRSRKRYARQQRKKTYTGNTRGHSKQNTLVSCCSPCSSPHDPDFLTASGDLFLPRSRRSTSSRPSVVSWPDDFTAAPEFNQHQGCMHRMFRTNAATVNLPKKQHECGTYTATSGYPVSQREQAIRHELTAGVHNSEPSSHAGASAVSAYTCCPNDVFAGDIEQLLTRLLLVDPSAAVAAASALVPPASSDVRSASLSAVNPVAHATAIATRLALQSKPSIAQNDYRGSPYVSTAPLPFSFHKSGLVVGGAAQAAQSSETTPGVGAAATAASSRNRCISSSCGAQRCRCCGNTNDVINRSGESGHRHCAPDDSSVIPNAAQQLPVAQAETQRNFEGEPINPQTKLPSLLCTGQPSRFLSETHMCNPWIVMQQLTGSSSSATPGTLKNSSSTSFSFSAASTSPPLLPCNAAELRNAAASFTALRNAENAFVLLEALQRQAFVQQQDKGRQVESQSQQGQMLKPLHPQIQRLLAVPANPSACHPQKERSTALRQQQDISCHLYGEDPQQQQYPPHVVRQREEFCQQQRATRQRREEIQQTQMRQHDRQQQQRQQQQQHRKKGEDECRFPQHPAPCQSQTEPHLLHTSQHLQLMAEPHPWNLFHAHPQHQQCKAPAVSYPVQLQAEIKKQLLFVENQNQTPPLPESAEHDQTRFVSGAADKYPEGTGGHHCRAEQLLTPDAAFLQEIGGTGVTREGEKAPQQAYNVEQKNVGRYNGDSGDTRTLLQRLPTATSSTSECVAHIAAARKSDRSTTQLACPSYLETVAAARRAPEETCAGESPRFHRTEKGPDSAGRKKGKYALESQKAGERAFVNSPTTTFNDKKTGGCTSLVKKKARSRASLVVPGILQVATECGQKPLQQTKQQQKDEPVALQQLVKYPESVRREKNQVEKQYRHLPPQQHQSIKKFPVSEAAGSTPVLSAFSPASSNTRIQNPSLSPNCYIAAQKQPKIWLQQWPQQQKEQRASSQPREEPTCRHGCASNETQAKDTATQQKPKPTKDRESQTPLLEQEKKRLLLLPEEDGAAQEAGQRKQRETGTDLSSYARRVFAQLNSSSKIHKTHTNSRRSPGSNERCSDGIESCKSSPYQSTGASAKQLRQPTILNLAKRQQLQQTPQEGSMENRRQRPLCATSAPIDVVSATAHRQPDATTAVSAEGRVSRSQAVSESPRMADTSSSCTPDKSFLDQSVSRNVMYAEQRGRMKKKSHHEKKQTTPAAARRVGQQRAAASAGHGGENKQKIKESTYAGSGKKAAPVVWRRK